MKPHLSTTSTGRRKGADPNALTGFIQRGFARALFTFSALLVLAVSGLAQLKVSVMPGYNQAVTYGNAALNEPVTIWGRAWGGTGAHTYVLDYGDGTSATGTVADLNFISGSKTYTSAGSKTITLTVTDGTSVVASRSAVVRVIAAPTHQERVNMAIEKGLLYLYRNQVTVSAEARNWPYQSGGHGADYDFGTTGAAVLAFEENGHLPDNDREAFIYSETVQRGLNYLLSQGGYFTLNAANQHSDGLAVRDCDSNANGKGAYLVLGGHQSYASNFGALAIILSKRNAAEAQSTIISGGPFNGVSYYELITDVMDQLAFSQGDGANRGGWVYNLQTTDNGRYDGSAQQWPCLVFQAARDLWSLSAPQWVIDNAMHGFKQLQVVDALDPAYGGIGYSAANDGWRNVAKTGGMLAGLALGNKFVGSDADADLAMQFVSNHWFTVGSWGNDHSGWASNWYAMYGMKKGLQLQGLQTITTPNGTRNWYQDVSAWLLGNGALLDAQGTDQVSTGQRHVGAMFGQHADGHWQGPEYPADSGRMDTAHGVLILTQAVTNPPPIAVIAPVGEQNLRNPSFAMDGSGSYHLDAAKTVVDYRWDWDASNGIDWEAPNATGARPTNPGYTTVGSYTVTLQVRDNSVPAMTATSTITVTVVNSDVAPVAISIPPGQAPYSGKIGEPITLDGSASYDPDDDEIVLYDWDTNGDGVFGDAFGVTTVVTYTAPRVGQVGLRVTANGKTSSNNTFIDIYTAENDVLVAGVSLSELNVGVSVNARVELQVHPDSTEVAYSNVVVRFYAGNPLLNGTQIGVSHLVTITKGQSTFIDTSLTNLNGATDLWVLADATQAIAEFNEGNNLFFFSAAQLFKNAEFTDGNVEFTSGGTYTNEPSTEPGTYTVATSPQALNPAFAAFGDHTTGSGPMMIVNAGGGSSAYEQTAVVQPHTWYAFSYWGASVAADTKPVLISSANGVEFAEALPLGETPGQWVKFRALWFSGDAEIGTFRVGALGGDAFALDDFSLVPVPGYGAPVTSLVAWKGMDVPGAGADARIPAGAVFFSFGEPSINAAGQVAFFARWQSSGGSGAGIFAGNPFALVVARGEQPAGFAAGARFNTLHDPALNEDGKIAFSGTVAGTGVVRAADYGVWSNALSATGDMELVMLEGQTAPGTPGAVFKAPSSFALQGQEVLVVASLTTGMQGAPGPGGTLKTDDRGVWAYRPGYAPVILIREGSTLSVDGAPKTVRRFKTLITLKPTTGNGRYQSREATPGSGHGHAIHVTFTDGTQAVYGSTELPLVAPMAWAGSPVLDEPGITFRRFGMPSIGFVGNTGFVFSADLTGASALSNAGIFGGFGTSLVRKGDVAPGTSGAQFGSFKDPVSNAAGDALFLANLKGETSSTSTNQGVFHLQRGAPGTLSLVARESGQPVGAAPGAQYLAFTSLGLPDGPMGPLVVAKLKTGRRGVAGPGGITAATDLGAWAVDAYGTNHQITQEGRVFFRKTIRNFSLLPLVRQSAGQQRSFNSQGAIIYRASNTDGTHSILKVQMPVAPEAPVLE